MSSSLNRRGVDERLGLLLRDRFRSRRYGFSRSYCSKRRWRSRTASSSIEYCALAAYGYVPVCCVDTGSLEGVGAQGDGLDLILGSFPGGRDD